MSLAIKELARALRESLAIDKDRSQEIPSTKGKFSFFMNDYIILKKDEDNYEVLEMGFSYLAFIYGPLWAAFNLLWIPLFFGLLITISLHTILYYLNIGQFYF